MKIKEERTLKLPKIMFKTSYANFMFVLILCLWFLNTVLFLVDYSHLELPTLGISSFILVAIYIIMLGAPGEAFREYAPQEHFDDLKKSVLYIVLCFIIFAGIFQYNKQDIVPEKLIQPQSIKITELTIFDSIKNGSSNYVIGYKDKKGILRIQSNFKTVEDRNEYLKTLIKDNKFKVQIFFNIDEHNVFSLEIIKRNIKE
jgi:hypothetical protein